MNEADSLVLHWQCWWTVFFAVFWASMQLKGYSKHWFLIRLLRGEEIDLEALNSWVDCVVGLMMPRPPSLGGKLRRSRSRSFGGDFPVRGGIKFERMHFSSGRSWSSILGVVLHKILVYITMSKGSISCMWLWFTQSKQLLYPLMNFVRNYIDQWILWSPELPPKVGHG